VPNLELQKEMVDNSYIDKDTLAEQESKNAGKTRRKKTTNSKNKKPNAFAQILNGDFLTKEFVVNNLFFIFFLFLLLILHLGKGYYGKQLMKDVEVTQKEVDEMTGDYIETKAKLEEETRRYKLVEKLSDSGLKETVKATKVIRIKKTKNTN
jgi:hypothetical protein